MSIFSTQYILFDLGGTLMFALDNWQPVLNRADRALADSLLGYGIELDTQMFRARLHSYYEQRDKSYEETTYHFVLRELLRDIGYDGIPEDVLRIALDAMYAVTQSNWALEADAPAMLIRLSERGVRMGILSNAGDDKDVQQMVASFHIRPYFDFVLTSAACYYRKPHPRAFELALAHWNISPREALMVGDSLSADVEGAGKLGMKTLWLTRRAEFSAAERIRIRPDFELPALAGLPGLFADLP